MLLRKTRILRARALLRFALALAVVHAGQGFAAEAGTCDVAASQQALAEAFGSVALMANLRKSADSVATIARGLLDEALDSNAWPEAVCPAGCAVAGRDVVYKVRPTAYVAEEKQRPECLRSEHETSERPLRFTTQRFSNLDELNAWIMAFSRGKGDDGEALYRACASNCSPRYTFFIHADQSSGFVLEPEVVCGLARDKKSTRYSLSTSLRTHCSGAMQSASAID